MDHRNLLRFSFRIGPRHYEFTYSQMQAFITNVMELLVVSGGEGDFRSMTATVNCLRDAGAGRMDEVSFQQLMNALDGMVNTASQRKFGAALREERS